MDAEKTKTKKEKPRWFTDLKWVFGILLFLSLTLLFITYDLYEITSKKNAVPALGVAIAINFSRTGLDDPGDVNKIITKAKKAGQTEITPLPGVTLRVAEIENKTPREVRLAVFERFAENIYSQDKIDLHTMGFLALVNKSTNLLIRNVLIWISVAAVVFAAGAIFFSIRFGKIITPALVVFLTAFPQLIFWAFLTTLIASQHPEANFVPEGKSFTEIGGYTTANVVNLFAKDLALTYLTIVGAAFAIIILALILNIAFHKKHKAAKVN